MGFIKVLPKTVEKTNAAQMTKTTFEKYSLLAFNALSLIAVVTLWIFCGLKCKNLIDWNWVIYTVPVVFVFASFGGLQSILPDSYKVAILRAAQKGVVISKNKFVEKTMFIKNIAFFTRGVITEKAPSVRMAYPTDKTTKDELLLLIAY